MAGFSSSEIQESFEALAARTLDEVQMLDVTPEDKAVGMKLLADRLETERLVLVGMIEKGMA